MIRSSALVAIALGAILISPAISLAQSTGGASTAPGTNQGRYQPSTNYGNSCTNRLLRPVEPRCWSTFVSIAAPLPNCTIHGKRAQFFVAQAFRGQD